MRIDALEASEENRDNAERLARSLERVAMRALSPRLKRIRSALRAGDVNAARDEAEGLSVDEVLRNARARVRSATRGAAQTGAAMLNDRERSAWGRGVRFPPEVDEFAVGQIVNATTRAFDRRVKPALLRRIERSAVERAEREAAEAVEKAAGDERAFTEGVLVAKALDPDELAGEINKFLGGQIRRVVDVSANATGTRVSAFGMLHEARVLGIARYRVDATLDSSTTQICRSLDGRVYDVQQAFERTRQVLRTSDPQRVKEMAPFPPDSLPEEIEIFDLDDAQLQERGFDVPPFHFLCRTVITPLDQEIVPDPGPDLSRFTLDPAFYEDQRERMYPALNEQAVVALRAREAIENHGLEVPDEALPDETLDQTILNRARNVEGVVEVARYTNNDYEVINAALRGAGGLDELTEQDRDAIRVIDEAMERAELPGEMFVRRGMPSFVGDRLEEGIVTGKTFQDDAFSSTTTNSVVSTVGGDSSIIHLPAGSSAILVRQISNFAAEEEVLLPRASMFRVLDVERNEDGTRTFKLEYVGVGERLPVDEVGRAEAPTADNVIKMWEPGDEGG